VVGYRKLNLKLGYHISTGFLKVFGWRWVVKKGMVGVCIGLVEAALGGEVWLRSVYVCWASLMPFFCVEKII
tara:strand:- start:172 stop:387 length:216 start_codon:yes stop_codon:yes gene_type:complete